MSLLRPNPNDFVSCSGSSLIVQYVPSVDPLGSLILKESGTIDICEKINSYASVTDMSYILACLRSGNTSVLSSKQPMYGDFTHMPKSPAEALQMVMDARASWNSLPVEVRRSFDNSFETWFASAGSEPWFAKMADKPAVNPNSVRTEVVQPVVKE